MKLFTHTLSLIFIFATLSCTEEIPLKDIHEPQVFLSGSISNKEKKVRVSLIKTANLNKQPFYESIPERNASIEFWSKDASGNKTMITDDFKSEEGHYESSENISLTEDSQYWIEIELANGDKLESSPEALLKPVRITDITFPNAKTRVHFEDPPDETNFYLINYTFESFGGNEFEYFEVVNDQLFDGNKDAFHDLDEVLGAEVHIELYNINYGTYSFYLNYEAQEDQKVEEGEGDPFNIFLPPPSYMTGNVWYKGKGRMALGSFGVLSGSFVTKEVPLPPESRYIPDYIKSYGYLNGPEDANIVILNSQGELSTELQNDVFDKWLANTGTENILRMNVRQSQTWENRTDEDDLSDQDVSFGWWEWYTNSSVSDLNYLVSYFKNQGREVYIMGASFGAFVVQEFIAQKGLYADGHLLMGGRLDMNEVFWKGLADGKKGHFVDGVTPVLTDQDRVFSRNLSRMAASIQQYRFTEKLNQFDDLSKVTYVYGELDEVVGRLTDAEIAFLKAKNVNVIKGAGDHQETLDDYIARGIKEAFGIE